INSLYPRIRRSAIRTPTVGSTGPRKSAGDEVAVVGFKDVQAGIEEIAFRHDDHVEAGGDFVTTKNLSNQSFSSISLDGAAKLARGGNAQSANAELIGQQEDRCVAAMDFDAAIVHPLKFRAASDPFGWSKLQLLAADREPLATLGAAAFQHQAAVLRAHSDQKTMRPLAVARIGLERANSLGHDIPSL